MVENSTQMAPATDWAAILTAYEAGQDEDRLCAKTGLTMTAFRRALRQAWTRSSSNRLEGAISGLRELLIAVTSAMSSDRPEDAERHAKTAATLLKIINGMIDLNEASAATAEPEFDESTEALDRFHAELERRIRRIAAEFSPDELRDWAGHPGGETTS